MRKFKLNHSRKRSHATTDVFGYITDKLDQEKQSKSGLDFGSVSSLPIKFLFMSQKKKTISDPNLRIKKVHSTNIEIFPFQMFDKVAQNWNMSE